MMMSDGITFPCGIRFRPTDEELLVYLQRKILDLPLPSNMINEIELYNYHPSEVGPPGEEVDNKSYFFTRIEAKHRNREKRNRVAKNGNWKAAEKPKFIYDYRNNKVGIKRSLVFMSSEKKKTNWHMEEYQTDEHMQKNGNSKQKLNKWVLCGIYEHINAEEKKKRKQKAAGSSIARNINPEETDDDQSQSRPRKRQKGDAVSKDEEITHHLDIIEWNEEEKTLLHDLLEVGTPIQIIPFTTEQVPPSLSGHKTHSITGDTDRGNPNDVGPFLFMDQPHDVGPSSFMGPDHICFSIPQDSTMSLISGPYLTGSMTGGDANQGQPDNVGPFALNGSDLIPFSISQGLCLEPLPGPPLTSSMTGGDANQGQPDDVGGWGHIPLLISQASSLGPLPGPHLSSSTTGGDANQGQFDDVGPFSFNGLDQIPFSISQGSKQGDQPSDLLPNETQSCSDWNEDFLKSWPL